jgi:hypothetical protein
MPAPSALATTVFLAIVLLVAVVLLRAGHKAGVGTPALAGLLLVYLAIPAALSRAGVLDRYDPLPAPALLLLLGLTLLTAVTVFSPLRRRLVSLPLAGIVALQSFRVAVEWWLHRMYGEGLVPEQMTFSGRNFDIISGLTGLLLGGWMLSGKPVGRGLVLAWNVLGLALLANIVAVAALSTPVPFRRFLEGPPNLLPSEFPWIWLPSFLVQVAFGSHLLVFRKLAGRTPAPA